MNLRFAICATAVIALLSVGDPGALALQDPPRQPTPTPAASCEQYCATIVDPRTFTDRIEVSFPMARVDARLFESACHEGNYSLANTLSAVRKADAERRETR